MPWMAVHCLTRAEHASHCGCGFRVRWRAFGQKVIHYVTKLLMYFLEPTGHLGSLSPHCSIASRLRTCSFALGLFCVSRLQQNINRNEVALSLSFPDLLLLIFPVGSAPLPFMKCGAHEVRAPLSADVAKTKARVQTRKSLRVCSLPSLRPDPQQNHLT